jgi:hypothetical protein
LDEEKVEQDIFEDSTEHIEIESGTGKLEQESNDIFLGTGRALNQNELYLLTAKRRTRIVYVLGPVGCGKTTFEAMLYQGFLNHVDENLLFAGSDTLVGFEERLKYLRLSSGKAAGSVERTHVDENNSYLHLRLLDVSEQEWKDIVFSDLSGEIYEQCVAKRSNLEEELKNIQIAQNVVLFLDGEKLADKIERNVVVHKAKTFLKTLRSSNCYRPDMRIDIVVSKNDLVNQYPDQDFVDTLEDKFKDLNKDYRLRFSRIEAIKEPNLTDEKKSILLIDLLKKWLCESQADPGNDVRGKRKKFKNEFNRFGEGD